MVKKISLVIDELTGCEGCKMSLLELIEPLLDSIMRDEIEIVYAPILLDAESFDHADIALLAGSIRNSEDLEKARWIREKVDILVATGACAYIGGIHGLGNLFTWRDLVSGVFGNVNHEVADEIPSLLEYTKPLWREVNVDYFIPGCPPNPDTIAKVLDGIKRGLKPHEIFEARTVCDECPLKREEKSASKVLRVIDTPVEQSTDRCLLEQGYLCLGPSTLAGCGALCPKKGVPCIGCYGFVVKPGESFDNAIARTIASIGASFKIEPPERIDDEILDTIGTFMKFILPSFFIPRIIK